MESPLDLSRLAELVDDLGSTDFVAETLGIYLAELPGRRAVISAAAAAGDVATLRGGAHSLGSTSALFGATELADLCRAIERPPSGQSEDDRQRTAAQWSAACDRAETALTGWLTDHGSKR